MSTKKLKVSEMDIDVVVTRHYEDGNFSEVLEESIKLLRDKCNEQIKTSIIPADRSNQTFTDCIQIGNGSITIEEIIYDEVGNLCDGYSETGYVSSNIEDKLEEVFENIKDMFDVHDVDILQGNWNNIEYITIDKNHVTFGINADGAEDTEFNK